MGKKKSMMEKEKMVTMSLRAPESLSARLRESAARDRRTLSSHATIALELGIELLDSKKN